MKLKLLLNFNILPFELESHRLEHVFNNSISDALHNRFHTISIESERIVEVDLAFRVQIAFDELVRYKGFGRIARQTLVVVGETCFY